MFDSTVMRAHVPAARARRGRKNLALGRWRGGISTKIHLKTGNDGQVIAFDLTGEEKGDCPHLPVLLDLGPDIKPRATTGDKGYGSNTNRALCRKCAAVPVIPHKSNPKYLPANFPGLLY